MPITEAVTPKPTESTRKSVERAKPAKTRAANSAESELKVPAVRKSRASSCPRGRRERTTATTGLQGSASKTSCERRTRSICTAPKPAMNWPQTTSSLNHAAVQPKCREMTTCQRDQRSVSAKGKYASQSHKAFTVIPPNPKKRREIQRRGCLSLEEVRLKQQEEMMQAKRKQKSV
ncbi:uncharacterized protein zgc:194621 isoform X2 [Mugil cephalus]|uniref:uncharacterized protein zgc:194621 isoform X2 n=2 Tax=Mugil cephalus TaxID=48193 RepID=UPI001FB79CC4|nr:uncharacterized protein zgc:194621 isoform X2 [Mugil cephalus]